MKNLLFNIFIYIKDSSKKVNKMNKEWNSLFR